jgi:hypothetical protein
VMTCGVTLEKAGVYSVIGFQAVTNHAHIYVRKNLVFVRFKRERRQ